MHDPQKNTMETAGSLTPQLEGAPHTVAHADRSTPSFLQKPDSKGGDPHS